MNEKVTVVTPTYNRAHFIGELIRFMKRQTAENWELVIVDDGSEDHTEEVVRDASNRDERIRFFRRKNPPKGAARCRNIGMEKSTGDYLIFLDSDDLLASFALEQRARYMNEHPDLDFAVFYGLKFNETPGDNNQLVNKKIDPERALEAFLSGNYPWHTAAPIWKKSALIHHGVRWDERLEIYQDLDFHIRVLLKGLDFEINTQARPDFFWRVHEGEKIGSYKNLPDKFDSCVHFAAKTGTLLEEHDKLNEETGQYLKRIFFSIARILTMENDIGKGLKLWRLGFQKNYIPSREYFRGKLLLHLFNIIYSLFGGAGSLPKTTLRKLYYKIIPDSYDKDKDVFVYDEEIKI